ncbi:MAG: energy-coupling factor transporter ATPase [Ruminococcaceae bacterium]|nr:energy-coupling factor transporter ATPase [Oscillospiraceae bacterium]
MSSFIEIKNLCFSYPGDAQNAAVPVLHDINLNIKKGEYVAVLGRNGSGKSTLAKLMNLILLPTSGSVSVNGKLLSEDLSDEECIEVRRNIGMVFQNPDNQLVATVVEEDIAFGPENLGVAPEEIRRRVDEALRIVGMSDFARHSPHQLSGGQKQRIAIAGIIAILPECIVFDESTAMLDPSGRKEVMDTIEELNRNRGITVITITHNMDEAVRADRVVVVDKGRIVKDGTPKQVFSRPEELWSLGLSVPQVTELFDMLRCLGADLPEGITDEEEGAKLLFEFIKNRN